MQIYVSTSKANFSYLASIQADLDILFDIFPRKIQNFSEKL
jgi:hypothetical protein